MLNTQHAWPPIDRFRHFAARHFSRNFAKRLDFHISVDAFVATAMLLICKYIPLRAPAGDGRARIRCVIITRAQALAGHEFQDVMYWRRYCQPE